MTAFGRLLARLTNLTTLLGMLAVALMMLHIAFDVIGKFIFNSPLPGTISMVSHYYMVVVAFLPLAFAETRNGHITVEVLTEFFPMRVQRHLFSWTYLVSATVFGLLTYRTWNEARTTQEAGAFIMEQSTKILTWPSYYILPIGTGLMVVVVLYRFFIYLTGTTSGLGEVPTLQKAASQGDDDDQ
ncbi:MAG: TRAP-type C4-dicarboxylate transport system permease small subunit [Gammaproteobacteria bacterium]|jgi:TRAP-type C4-dicarboxylate transport system permease small subunit